MKISFEGDVKSNVGETIPPIGFGVIETETIVPYSTNSHKLLAVYTEQNDAQERADELNDEGKPDEFRQSDIAFDDGAGLVYDEELYKRYSYRVQRVRLLATVVVAEYEPVIEQPLDDDIKQ